MSGLVLPQRRSFANGNSTPGTTERLRDQRYRWSLLDERFSEGLAHTRARPGVELEAAAAGVYVQATCWPPVVDPLPVPLGRLGPKAGPAQRLVAEHFRLILGVRLALGVPPELATPYARSLPASLGLGLDRGNVGAKLKALCQRGVIEPAGRMPPLPGQRDGTRKYRPPADADDFGDQDVRDELYWRLDRGGLQSWGQP